MLTERELALRYAPIVHFDRNETIPLRAVGYSVLRQSGPSPSFRRELTVPADAECIVEYAYYWDYDIQHMYDLEHMWVTVGRDGSVRNAQGSFHGRYLNALTPELPGCRAPEGTRVHIDCQPGKHAFMPNGQLFRLMPGWYESCNARAGGAVLVGNIFGGAYQPTAEDDALSERYIREHLAFEPSMAFTLDAPDVPYMPWPELREKIPQWIADELTRLRLLYGITE